MGSTSTTLSKMVIKISVVILGLLFIGSSYGGSYPSVKDFYFPTLGSAGLRGENNAWFNPAWSTKTMKRWTIAPRTIASWTGQTGQAGKDRKPREVQPPPAEPMTLLPY